MQARIPHLYRSREGTPKTSLTAVAGGEKSVFPTDMKSSRASIRYSRTYLRPISSRFPLLHPPLILPAQFPFLQHMPFHRLQQLLFPRSSIKRKQAVKDVKPKNISVRIPHKNRLLRSPVSVFSNPRPCTAFPSSFTTAPKGIFSGITAIAGRFQISQ